MGIISHSVWLMNSWIVEPTVKKRQPDVLHCQGVVSSVDISQCICDQHFGNSDEERVESVSTK